MRTFLIFTKFLETIACVIRMFGYSTVFHLVICGRIELLHDELFVEDEENQGWRLQPPVFSCGCGRKQSPVNVSQKRAKNRKSGAFWCILVHDLWKSFRGCTTGGGGFATLMNVVLVVIRTNGRK